MIHGPNKTNEAFRPERIEYEELIRRKAAISRASGFEISQDEINPICKPHQKDVVQVAVRKGCYAIFAAFGLGKTFIQLEIVRIILSKAGGRGLIVCPLGVRQEFIRDAEKLGLQAKFIRRIEECGETGIYLTNYETIRDGKLDPRLFTVVSLDEAAVLRGFGGTKTFRELMKLFECHQVRYKFVATATPGPNNYIELLAYAAFLDVMDVAQAKTRFFKRDSTKADSLTLHPHKEREFCLWLSTWAVFLLKPSDLGHSDEGYELPEVEIHWHEIPTVHGNAGEDRGGQGRLLKNSAIGVTHAAREKRESIQGRLAKLMELRALDPSAHRVIWHDLEIEREALEDALPMAQYGRWFEFKDGNTSALELYERHYSAYKYADGRKRELFCGPGEKMVLLTEKKDALFAWRKFIDASGQKGINCAVFRNESNFLSSELILEAMAAARMRWPGERLYTYVNPEEISSSNPGCCFKKAGWTRCGLTKGGLVILEALPGLPVPSIQKRVCVVSVFGSEDMDEREQAIRDFCDGKIQELSTKLRIAGVGTNMQRHCAWAIFFGIGFKFHDFIQGVHRIVRYLQTRKVRLDLIYTEAEREIRRALEAKWEQHKELTEKMAAMIREYGLATNAIHKELSRSLGIERVEVRTENAVLVNNDCVLEARDEMQENSVGLILTSPPFSTQYEYCPYYADFGHSESNKHFWQQMDYLIPELYRVLMPGRIAAIHVKDRIVPGGINGHGFQTVYRFHSDCCDHFENAGFAYLGMKTIVTDVVRENNQTYRLGWTEQCKDGSRMGVGMPEYLLLFRKPPTDSSNGYADIPVIKSKADYSRSRWQVDAHGFERSSGQRLLQPADFAGVPHERIFKMFREYSLNNIYDYGQHVCLSESLETCDECGHIHIESNVCNQETFPAYPELGFGTRCRLDEETGRFYCICRGSGRLPVTFMLLQPQSWHPDVWTDITRMLTLNGAQSANGREMHLCPMQFDLADRVITQMSNPGDVVFDPFGGIGTVPYRALLLNRKSYACELSPAYFKDMVFYVNQAEAKKSVPTLFELIEAEAEVAQ